MNNFLIISTLLATFYVSSLGAINVQASSDQSNIKIYELDDQIVDNGSHDSGDNEPPRKKQRTDDNEIESDFRQEDNLFSLLPDEIIFIIYDFCDIESQYNLGKTYSLFRQTSLIKSRLSKIDKLAQTKRISSIFEVIERDDVDLYQHESSALKDQYRGDILIGATHCSPLLYAVYLANSEFVKMLLANNIFCDPTWSNPRGHILWSESLIVWQSKNRETINCLIEHNDQPLAYALHFAVSVRDFDLVSKIRNNPKYTYRLDQVCRPNFSMACLSGRATEDYFEHSPLSFVIMKGDKEMLELLLKDVNEDNLADFVEIKNDISINQAVAHGRLEMFDILVAHGFPIDNFDTENGRDQTPIMRAYLRNNRTFFHATCRAIVSRFKTTKKSILHHAADSGCVELLRYVCDRSQNPDLSARDSQGKAPLHYAAQRGSEACVSHLLQNGDRVNQRDENGQTALHHAVIAVERSLVEYLLECGADPRISDFKAKTPAEYAFEATQYNATETPSCIIALLVSYGGYANASYKKDARKGVYRFRKKPTLLYQMNQLSDNGGKPQLPYYKHNNIKIKQYEAERDNYGRFGLHYAAQQNHISEMDRLLSQHNNRVDCVDFVGRTPLHYATWNKDGYAAAKLLLSHGANPELKDDSGRTPFDYAVWLENKDIVNLLQNHIDEANRIKASQHAQMDFQSNPTPPIESRRQNNVIDDNVQNYGQHYQDLIQIVKTNKNLNSKDQFGKTLFHYACILNDISTLKTLMGAKTEPNIQDALGKTPLMYAIDFSKREAALMTAQYLAQHGPVKPFTNVAVKNYAQLQEDTAWDNYPPYARRAYEQHVSRQP